MTTGLFLYDDDIEMAIISATLFQEYRKEITNSLRPEHFYREKNRLIFETVLELDAVGLDPDAAAVCASLKESGNLEKAGGYGYISSLLESVPSVVNINHYIKKIKNLGLKRNLTKVGNAIIKLGSDKTAGSGTECLDKAQAMLIELSNTGSIDSNVCISDSVVKVCKSIEDAYNNGGQITGIPSGFYDFDQATNGLIPGSLYIIAARTSEGKSAFAGNIAINVAREGYQVQIFSLEMTDSDLSSRLLSAESKVKFSKLQRGDLDAHEWQRITNAACVFDEIPLYINDTAGLSNLDLMRLARRYKIEHGIKLLIVDYLQLMRGQHPKDKVQDVSDISRTLKIIAKDLQIPVIALSQLNRNIEHRQDKTPMLSDLRDSGQLEQDADVIAFIHTVDGEKVVRIAKHRQGPKGQVRVYFAEDFVQFQNGVEY